MSFCRCFLALVCLVCVGCGERPQTGEGDTGGVTVAEAMGGDAGGFARVTEPRPFVFPLDHGPHPDYKTEWWYLTGNVQSETGRRFGYQLTIFRIGLIPPGSAVPRSSRWAAHEIYMGHFAITDVQAGTFTARERLARAALGLAGARAQPLMVWVENWQLAGAGELFPLRISAQDGENALDLILDTRKPVVLQGDKGFSAKSATPGNASYYYSYTRLATEGSLRVAGEHYTVRGQSWMDREWSTSALEQNQAGWDWFSLQLDDDTELMYYRLRRKQGGLDPASAGAWIDHDGNTVHLGPNEVHAEVVRHWRSVLTQVRYPIEWRLSVPAQGLELAIEPLVDNQELRLTVRYWEGAVRVSGSRNGRTVSGYGYLELAGYSDE